MSISSGSREQATAQAQAEPAKGLSRSAPRFWPLAGREEGIPMAHLPADRSERKLAVRRFGFQTCPFMLRDMKNNESGILVCYDVPLKSYATFSCPAGVYLGQF